MLSLPRAAALVLLAALAAGCPKGARPPKEGPGATVRPTAALPLGRPAPVAGMCGDDTPLGREWRRLCHAEGCLQEAGRMWSGEPPPESVLARPAWRAFLGQPRAAVAAFLIGRLDSLVRTAVHACPDQDATEGELAVYALQQALQANWRDYAGANAALRSAAEAPEREVQETLRLVLFDPGQRRELADYFRRALAGTRPKFVPAKGPGKAPGILVPQPRKPRR